MIGVICKNIVIMSKWFKKDNKVYDEWKDV